MREGGACMSWLWGGRGGEGEEEKAKICEKSINSNLDQLDSLSL